jgi:hypothetical protein
LLAAAAALMAASPAAAGGGYLGLEYDTGEASLILGEADGEGWQGEGAFGFGSGPGLGGQINGSVGTMEIDDIGLDLDTWSLAGHLWWDGGGWRIGGVVATADHDGGGAAEFDETAYGIEGTFDAGSSAVIFGSLTAGDGDFAGLFDYDTWNLDGGANFYFTPNMRVGGFVGTGNVDTGGGDIDSFSFGVNGEFQPWAAPISITVGWNMFELDDIDVDANMFRVGARWNFGAGTLRDRDNATPFNTTTGLVSRALGTW